MFIPIWLLIASCSFFFAFAVWALAAAQGRNPFPFPDSGSRIFTTPSAEAKAAVIELLANHGLRERFEANSSGILRSILWDGTIINSAPSTVIALLDGATSCIGLVSASPQKDAEGAVRLFHDRGFSAKIVEGVEPSLPIVFVVTDALSGTAINFRPHVTKMPRPK